jgi:hypothetical protein
MELRHTIVAGLVLAAAVTACGDEVTITQTHENRPPQILLSGPEYDVTAPIEAPFPTLWVLATDADGAGDIAAVILSVSSISLLSTIVRPDDAEEDCRRPFYADMDTIDIGPHFEKRTFRIEDMPLGRGTDGMYRTSLSYYLLTEGGLGRHGTVFGESIKQCRWGYDYLYMIEEFGLYPPALPAPRDVYVTYAEFSISGITMTVYDQSGAEASVEFPDARVFFTNSLESRVLP